MPEGLPRHTFAIWRGLLLAGLAAGIRRPPGSCWVKQVPDLRGLEADAAYIQPRTLFENERCLVSELVLLPGKVGQLPWAVNQSHLVVLQVGRGLLQPLVGGEEKGPPLALSEGKAAWDPFGVTREKAAGGEIMLLRNAHPDCESRTFFVGVKEGWREGRVWRGQEVKPGRRFEEEVWGDGEEEGKLEEERVLRGNHSRVIGNELLLGNADVAVWSFVIPPGEDAPIHRHQHSYFFLNLGESRTCGLSHDGTVHPQCATQTDGLVTWIDCSLGQLNEGPREGGPRRKVARHVHGVRNVGTTWFRQFIVEFLQP